MKKIKVKMYNQEIELYIGKAKKNGQKIIRRHGRRKFIEKYSCGFCFAICFDDSKGKARFIISIDKKTPVEYVYHEALHMSYYILDDRLVKFDVHNHEVLCYLQGHIAEKILKQLKKCKR